MNFLSVLYAKAGITVDGVTTLNNTATALTPATNDNSTKIATTAFVKNQNYYPYPTGTTAQYVRGDGSLATFTQTGGGGSSVSYYLNGSVSQGTIGGNAYYEMSKNAIIGTNADFSINADGYVAQFVTDAGDPALLSIPGGNWNFEMFFSASSGGGTPSFYVELYKYDGTTLTLIASGSAAPESITGGTSTDLYITALAVPTTTLTLTDRLAVRVYVNHSGRTITLHTQNGHLCQVITTFTTGLTALNGLTAQVQNFAVGTGGTDFNISSVTDTHTFNLPTASATKRGALSSIDWSAFDAKVDFGDLSATSPLSYNGSGVFSIAQSSTSTNGYLSSTDWTTFNNKIAGSGTANYIAKFTSGSVVGNSIIYDNGTSVGIGTATPTGKLEVAENGGGTWISANKPTLFISNGGTSNAYYALGIKTNSGEIFSVTNAGNVGIGTSSPAATLDVRSKAASGSITAPTFRAFGYDTDSYFQVNNNASNSADIKLTRSDATTMFEINGHTGLAYFNGNIGVGVTPSAWTSFSVLQNTGGSLIGAAGELQLWQNAYYDGASKYYATGTATRYGMTAGQHRWYYAVSGSANAALTWVQAMTLDASGNLGVGTTTPNANLEIFKATDGASLRLSSGQNNSTHLTTVPFGIVEFFSSDASSPGAIVRSSIGSYPVDTAASNGADLVFNNSSPAGVFEGMRLTSTGNLGIGTATPTFKLDVNGTARVSGAVTAAAGLFNTGSASDTWASSSSEGLAIKGTALSAGISTISTALDNTALRIGAGGSQKTGILINGQTTGAGSSVLVSTGGATRLTINSTGNATFTADATINGVRVGKGNNSKAENTAVGTNALANNSTGDYNTAIGAGSLTANTTGISNTAVGRLSLVENTIGIGNVGVGLNSLFNNLGGNDNVGIGRSSLFTNINGGANTAIGNSSLFFNTASNNTAVGYEAAYTNASGTDITAIGYRALKFSTGVSNTAVGSQALTANTTGANNTAIGKSALIANTTGFSNTAIGESVLLANVSGTYNTAIGSAALSANVSGSNNIAIGRVALQNNTASNNTALGFQAGNANTSGANNIFIGYQSTGVSITESNRTWIGNGSTTSTWLAGNVLIGTTTDNGNKLEVNGSVRFTNGTNPYLALYDGTSTSYLQVSGGNLDVRVGGANAITFNTNSAEQMRITPAGLVGIGTTSPATKLDVDSTGYSIFANNSSGNRIVKIGTQSASGEPAIQATLSNGTARYLMLNPDGGNILIGTTGDAGYKLDVNGTARIQGQLAVNHSLSGNYGAIIYNTSATGEGLVVRGGSTASHTSFVVQPYDGSVTLFSVVATGTATFSSSVTATNFIGAGTGLTGTASALSIGGSAGTAGYTTGTAGGAIRAYDLRTIAPNSMSINRMGFGFTSFNNNNTSPWADYIHLRSYGDSTGGADNLIVFNKSTIGMRIYQQTFGSSTAYSSYKDIAFTDGTNASGTWGISITGNANYATTAGALTSMNISQFTNDAGYITSTSSTFSYTASVTLSPTWQNTGVSSANLTGSGVYIVTCNANDFGVSGGQYNCTYTGIMYWFAGGTNGSNVNEIVLHHTGHADNGRYIYLRTINTVSADGKTYLQISGNGTNSGASNYQLTFKKLL